MISHNWKRGPFGIFWVGIGIESGFQTFCFGFLAARHFGPSAVHLDCKASDLKSIAMR